MESGDQAVEEWRARLHEVVSSHGGPSAVARLSDVPLRTLNNHLSGRTKKPPLDDLRKIAEACGRSPAWLSALDEEMPVQGFAEPELVPFRHQSSDRARNSWVVKTRALDLAGVLPGDVVDFDDAISPRDRDIVLVQAYDDEAGSAETLMRIYLAPYAMIHSSDDALSRRPLEVDGVKVRIAGVLVELRRTRSG